MTTLIYQSYRTQGVPGWIDRCLESVRQWAKARGYRYEFVDDRIFELVPGWYRRKAGEHVTILTDLARLELARRYLAEGLDRVIWIDADVLVFDPEAFDIAPDRHYAFCREVWVTGEEGRLKQRNHVNNAVAMFARDNAFLDFYIHACQAIVQRADVELSPTLAIKGKRSIR